MKNMTLKLAVLVGVVLGVSGCAIKQPQTTTVYIPKGAIQCESEGMTLSDSTKRLASVGVKSLSAQCGDLTGVMNAAVCGGETGKIIVHSIASKEVLLAAEAGYKNANELKSADGLGYTMFDCD
ncbi:hypothetical protein [Enterovibrio coralii]|uniref:Lipoprotein n=1 Tax=Enterovibrio coralii TaxID=294935 RepID=A0A135I8D8_9GAMM|nr:hypothetical protein [Enterovibrio coralii]KXF81716.1 hypothetical protein ATN88_03435 [Enterovibrio coralii]